MSCPEPRGLKRRTDAASGNRTLGFAVDDRFPSAGPHRVAFKVTYRDTGHAVWRLAFPAGPDPAPAARVACGDTGEVRTVTFIRDGVRFPARDLDFDFTLEAEQGDAVIKFVRVIRLD